MTTKEELQRLHATLLDGSVDEAAKMVDGMLTAAEPKPSEAALYVTALAFALNRVLHPATADEFFKAVTHLTKQEPSA